jgi:hypothetical protein
LWLLSERVYHGLTLFDGQSIGLKYVGNFTRFNLRLFADFRFFSDSLAEVMFGVALGC